MARLSKLERRETILAAATEALVTAGPEAVSMEGVAARVGVSKPVVYDHFPNRAALVVAIHEEYERFLAERMTAALAAAAGTMEELVALSIRVYFDAIEDRGHVVRVLLGSVQDDADVQKARNRARSRWVRFWAAKLQEVEGVGPELAHDAIALVSVMAEAAATMWQAGQLERATAERLYTQLTVGALRNVA